MSTATTETVAEQKEKTEAKEENKIAPVMSLRISLPKDPSPTENLSSEDDIGAEGEPWLIKITQSVKTPAAKSSKTPDCFGDMMDIPSQDAKPAVIPFSPAARQFKAGVCRAWSSSKRLPSVYGDSPHV